MSPASLHRRWTAAYVSLLLLLGGHSRAQDFENIAPKEPLKTRPGHVVNENAHPIAARGEGDVLVPQLKGVVLVADPKEVALNGVSSAYPIVPGKVALARRGDFNQVIEPYLGQAVTLKSLAQMTRAIVTYYREHDRPVVNVYVPQQNITTGFVQVVVQESRLEKVDATGQRWFSKGFLLSQLTLREDEPLSGRQMRDDLALINRNPFLQSDFLLAPGDAPGTTDVLLHTQDRFPLRPYLDYENSGNQFTGEDRYEAGFNYGNLFGLGEQVSYQYTQNGDANRFFAHAGTFIAPLPWHHLLTIFGDYSSTHTSLGDGLGAGGINWQVSGRYEIPLPSTAQLTHSVFFGGDFKRSNNALAFGVLSLFNTNTDVDQFVGGYQATYTDDYGSTFFSGTGFFSPGGISEYDSNGYYRSQRAGSRANYIYGQLVLDRTTRLPFDFTWTLRSLLQESDGNLLPSEQLGLGGYETVRGYDEREANGDNGYFLSTEIATPPVSIANLFGTKAVKDQLQFFGFVDYGGTSLHNTTPADVNPNVNLLSAGPGVRYTISPYLSVRFDYGFQMINTGFGPAGQHGRADLGILVSY
jgi:hemolysin activation/secretion protein